MPIYNRSPYINRLNAQAFKYATNQMSAMGESLKARFEQSNSFEVGNDPQPNQNLHLYPMSDPQVNQYEIGMPSLDAPYEFPETQIDQLSWGQQQQSTGPVYPAAHGGNVGLPNRPLHPDGTLQSPFSGVPERDRLLGYHVPHPGHTEVPQGHVLGLQPAQTIDRPTTAK